MTQKSPHSKFDWPAERPPTHARSRGYIQLSDVRSEAQLNPLSGDLGVSIHKGDTVLNIRGPFGIGGSRDALELLRRELDLALSSMSFASGFVYVGTRFIPLGCPHPTLEWKDTAPGGTEL